MNQMWLFHFLLAICFALSTGFTSLVSQNNAPVRLASRLQLVPIVHFQDDLTFFGDPEARRPFRADGTFQSDLDDDSGEIYELCFAEESDLPDAARFIVGAFGADPIRLSQDLNAFERLLMQPAAELMNGYSGIIAFAEVLSGLRQRLQNRLQTSVMDISPPNIRGLEFGEKVSTSAKESLVLVLGKRIKGRNEGDDWHVHVIASVELRLELCDAKIPFTLPWLDRVERRIASAVGFKQLAGDIQPYLSTLCVDEKYRGKNIGRAMVHCVEDIAAHWGYSRLYLHVDPDNTAAYMLYKSEGYNDVGKRWNPFWAGSSSTIGYFVKNLDTKERTHRLESTAEEQPVTRVASTNRPDPIV